MRVLPVFVQPLHGDLHMWDPSVVCVACGEEGEAHFCVCKSHSSMCVTGMRPKALDLPATHHPSVVG